MLAGTSDKAPCLGDVSRELPSVLIVHDRPDDFRDLLQARFPKVRFEFATCPDEVVPQLEATNPQIVFSIKHIGFPGPTHRPIVLHPSVRWVQVGGSGYEHIQPWDAKRIKVTNCAGVLSRHLAETVTGAMLALNGGFIRYLEQQQHRVWKAYPFRPLSEQTLLVVGLGQIGRHVAANAKALGMRVLAIRRTERSHPAVDGIYTPTKLPDVIAHADVVSLHVRLTAETNHLFDASMFSAMKKGALLINTARGPVVDEAALVHALTSGQLGGAYLDVFETEPLPESSPLWQLPSVLLTPHASDNVSGWPRKFAEFFANNLDCWLNGRSLRNVVSV